RLLLGAAEFAGEVVDSEIRARLVVLEVEHLAADLRDEVAGLLEYALDQPTRPVLVHLLGDLSATFVDPRQRVVSGTARPVVEHRALDPGSGDDRQVLRGDELALLAEPTELDHIADHPSEPRRPV